MKSKRIIFSISIAMFFLVGIGLIFNGFIKNEIVKQNQTTLLKNLNKNEITKNKRKKGQYNFSEVHSLGWNDVANSSIANHKSYSGIGAIAIPSVNLYLPIGKGLSNYNMSVGGATMRENQIMGKGNYPIAGHYMTSQGVLFSPLEQTKIGQKIYLTDLTHIYTYQISMKKIVSPKAVWLVNDTSENIVTLITCADDGQMRWAIRGNLVNTEKATKDNLKIFGI